MHNRRYKYFVLMLRFYIFCIFRQKIKSIFMKPYMKYGLLAALVCIILSLVVSMGEMESRGAGFAINLLTYVAITAAIIMALRDKRTRQGDFLTYGQGVGEGMRVATITGLATALAHYINVKFINRQLTETLYAKMEEQLEAKSMSAEEMEMAGKWGKTMIMPGGQAIMVLIGYLLIGIVISLIAAAVLRKEDGNITQNNLMYSPDNNPQV
ncbi:MAG: DUF4199 domain-containing protein [Sphingobacteriales bacterium]|nr:MAG: DUF4199 domain-containing protein [Sphingobacteriales bacterium]